MAHTYLECNQRFLVGARFTAGILAWDEANPNTDISAATALMAIYDEDGAVTLASGACGVNGTTLLDIERFVDTTGWAIGKYRAVFWVTLGILVQPVQYSFHLDPLPGPQ